MKWLTLAILMASLSGCYTLTEEQKYEREDRATIRRDKIAHVLNYCASSGGILRIDVRNLSRGQLMKMNRIKYFTAENVPRGLHLIHVQCLSSLR